MQTIRMFALCAASSITAVLFLITFKSLSLAAYYFVDITVSATVKKNESEMKAWVSFKLIDQIICNCQSL